MVPVPGCVKVRKGKEIRAKSVFGNFGAIFFFFFFFFFCVFFFFFFFFF